jgi:hypothetical protein
MFLSDERESVRGLNQKIRASGMKLIGHSGQGQKRAKK